MRTVKFFNFIGWWFEKKKKRKFVRIACKLDNWIEKKLIEFKLSNEKNRRFFRFVKSVQFNVSITSEEKFYQRAKKQI